MRCVNICWQAMISRIVCWRAMQHSLIAASAGLGLSFGSFLCRCHLLLFRCSNLPWQQKHTRAWIAALNMRGDVSAHDSAWPLSPSRWCLILWDSSVTAINICLSVYNCIEAVLTHEHQRRQKDDRNKRCWPSHRWRYLMLYVLVGHRMWFLRMSGIYIYMGIPATTPTGRLAHFINIEDGSPTL